MEKMNRKFAKPRIFCSKCITFDYCRWNSAIIASDRVESLKDYVIFTTHCPEVEIGLGVPRDSLRIVMIQGKPRLYQPKTGLDHTDKMDSYANEVASNLGNVDGFILKAKSPSCGLSQIRIYKGINSPEVQSSGSGIFGAVILKKFPHHPVTDEGRIKNEKAWEHFLTQIFTLAAFRSLGAETRIKALIEFQTKNKLLLMAYNQSNMRKMGQLIGSHQKGDIASLFHQYQQLLMESMAEMPNLKSHINVLEHTLGYFKEKLSKAEKQFFLDEITRYRQGIIPLSICIHLMREFIVRFQEPYLAQQTYFQPYPEALILK